MQECRFYGYNGVCTALINTVCSGECSFFKTDKDFEKGQLEAIKKNLLSGKCKECNYPETKKICEKIYQKSLEVEI